ncbi:MAG: CIA30 family protein [Treponema sp.]|jgi:hypothetical protein|nr:CIA30 family protein [Treponema sp.]
MKQFCVFMAVFLFIGVIFPINAQDLIVLKDGNIIEAKVMEISSSEIRYKRFTHLDGPMVVIQASSVFSIKYENGMVEVINTTARTGQGGTSGPQSNLPPLLQSAINQLPAIPIAGRNLKFQLNSDTWTAQVSGKDFLSGTLTFIDTDEGYILTLKQTHTYFRGRQISTPGANINLEYKEGPPSSLRLTSRSVNSTGNSESSDYIIFSDAGIDSNVDGATPKLKESTTANFDIGRENIEEREQEVLTMNVKLANGSGWRVGQFSMSNPSIVQKLKEGSGVRFNVLGDGKKWVLQIATEDIKDYCYYEAIISTKKNKVVSIDIPYSKLKQPSGWGKKMAFNQNSINYLNLQYHTSIGASGSSAIKIFDFEIY